jgi:hypothetical protein
MDHGIDYSSCDAAIQSAREDSCHLLKWAKEIGLEYGKGRIRLGDLFNNLKQWYVSNDILDIEETATGKEKLVWNDDGDKYDPFVRAPRLMRTAIAKLFPNAKFSEKGEYGVFVLGVQSQQFAISPNFGSFESGEEQKEGIATVSQADPNPDPNYFASVSNFESANTQNSKPDPTDPNYLVTDANKLDNHAVSDATDANYPKSTHSQQNTQQTPLKIGDRVDFWRYGTACEKFNKIRNLPDSGYTVRNLSNEAGILKAEIKHPKMKASLVVDAEWLMHSLEVAA